jgi:hypothetical protein
LSAITETAYYALCDDGPEYSDWFTLMMSEGDAMPLFTTEAKALAFRASAPHLARYPVVRLVGSHLVGRLRNCMTQGIHYVTCDPASGHVRYTLILRFLSEGD